jgi:hypothetical protein
MSRRIVCAQCGAPHRLASPQTRFRCDYCQALIELTPQLSCEVWQLGAIPSASDCQAAALRWLQEQEIGAARVRVDTPQWATHWQIFSDAGEEFRADASRFAHPLLAQLSLPAGPRVESNQPLPEPRIARDEAERAALAGFRAAEATISQVRLLHQPVVPLQIELRGGTVAALYQAADERLVVEALPDSARRRQPEPRLLIAYAAYTSLCLLLGMLLANPLGRLSALAVALAAAMLTWPRIRREAR